MTIAKNVTSYHRVYFDDLNGKRENNLNIVVIAIIFMVLEAKCPECGRSAKVDDDIAEVKCEYCGFHVLYDEYIEIMKDRAVSMVDDFK